MPNFFCPFCNQGEHTNTRPTGSLPNNYEGRWQDIDIAHTCPDCQNTFQINVRTSLETGKWLFINQTPKPQKVGFIWYAMGAINSAGIKVSAVCKDEIFARMIGLSHNRKHTERLYLLKITSEGYFNEEGRKLAENVDDKQKINYLEIL